MTRNSKKIPAHYGMKDYYNYFVKKYPEYNISRATYNEIITEYNKELCNILIEDLQISLPFRMGKIEVLKQKRKVYINENNKVINTNPVDWKATNELWERSEEAKERKILIRHSNIKTGGYVFRVDYNKSNAVFKNKRVYFFKAIRDLARNITERIEDYSLPKYDTFLKQ